MGGLLGLPVYQPWSRFSERPSRFTRILRLYRGIQADSKGKNLIIFKINTDNSLNISCWNTEDTAISPCLVCFSLDWQAGIHLLWDKESGGANSRRHQWLTLETIQEKRSLREFQADRKSWFFRVWPNSQANRSSSNFTNYLQIPENCGLSYIMNVCICLCCVTNPTCEPFKKLEVGESSVSIKSKYL